MWCLLSVSIFASSLCLERPQYKCDNGGTPKYVDLLGPGGISYRCCSPGMYLVTPNVEQVRCVPNQYVSSGRAGNSYCLKGSKAVYSSYASVYPAGCCPNNMEYVDGRCVSADGQASVEMERVVPYDEFLLAPEASLVNEKYCASGCKDDNEGIVCLCYAFGDKKGSATCAANGEFKETSEITEQDLADIQNALSAGNPQKPITNGEYCTNQALDAYTRKPVEGEYAKCLACMGGNSGAEGSTTGYTYTAGQCFGSSIDTLPTSIARLVVGLGIGLLFIKITMAGLSLLLGNDSPQKLKETKEEIFAIITAFIFLSMGLIVLRYIGYDILKLGDFLPSGF